MFTKCLRILTLVAFIVVISTSGYSQRSNYNEQDVVMMKTQQSVGTNIMKLLEKKMVDSCMYYFKDKSAATKKKLSSISTSVQKFKSKHQLAVSPDAPDDLVNHIICKYTSSEGVKTHYKVLFIFGRYDKTYKVTDVILK